ncbi:ATP-binding protein [Roseateles sp. PN1]|uniref:ATP-binding protein n=1 Tax=Roseateles sp. PN1 TaxID=3137372 RepID=UPI003138699D
MYTQPSPGSPGVGDEGSCPNIASSVKLEQLTALLGRSVTPSIAGLAYSMVPVLLFWPHLSKIMLLSWLAMRALIVSLRWADVLRFKRLKPATLTLAQTDAWRHRHLLLLGLDAFSWGVMGHLFYLPGAPELNGLILASVLAVMAISLFSLGNTFSANLVCASLAVLPMVLHQFSLGTMTASFTGLGLLVFLGLALSESRKMEQRLTELLRHRFANAWVAEQRQQALQTAEHSSTSKSRFVAVMSHEIRTPLNGILGMTQLLERSNLDGTQREQVNIMRRSGQHLLALVNDILDLARIESGKLAVDTGPVNLRETVDDVCQLLSQTAHEKGLAFDLRLSPALPLFALGDASRIKQVLHNLIGNAIKFTEKGHVRVEVATVHDMRAGTMLRFAVHDSGEGIAADQLERVFAPFEQAQDLRRKTSSKRKDGTGLGLTISRELARAMGGDLRCSSAPGHGSLFEFTLPLQPCEASSSDKSSEAAAPSTAAAQTDAAEPAAQAASGNLGELLAAATSTPGSSTVVSTPASTSQAASSQPAATAKRPARQVPRLSGRVLLVDDSAVNVLVASSMLEQCGLQVDQAENGQEALDQLKSKDYDLVLMDCQMPVLDGFEATRQWRSIERRDAMGHVPIVALTASAVNGDRDRCIQSGMDDYLVKPFEMDDLLGVAQRHLPVTQAA